MPPRTELTPEREAVLAAELRLYQKRVRDAEEDLRVHVSRAYEAGMSLAKLRDALGLKSADTTRRWKAEGDEARARRRDGEENPTPG